MIKDIHFSGYTTQPSDYLATDGELATAINTIPEDSSLKPVMQPKVLFDIGEGKSVLAIHDTAQGKHYIIGSATSDSYKPEWINEADENHTAVEIDQTLTGVKSASAIGNTLIFLCDGGLHYFLWKTDTESYTYLGTHIPELPISFGLQGERVESYESFDIAYNESVPQNALATELHNDSLINSLTNQTLAQVNKFIAENYTEGNRFMYPFFVRYAYRLYDGSLTMHSAPILMCCASGQNPYVLGGRKHWTNEGADGTWDSQRLEGCKVYGALYRLDFAVVAQDYINQLKEWSDIVTSVDIFVSAPLYSYDQSGKCKGIEDVVPHFFDNNGAGNGGKRYCVCKATHGGAYSTYYQYHSMAAFFWYGKTILPGWSVRLPMKGENTQRENIASASNFYFLQSYSLNSLSTTRKIVDIENGYFKSLVNREVMTDDYDSHCKLAAQMGFNYNSRLNLAGIRKILPNGFHMSTLINYTNGYLQGLNGKLATVDRQYENTKQTISLFVYIKKPQKNIVSRSLDLSDTFMGMFSEAEFAMFTPQPFIYYPDADAYKAVLFFHRWVNGGSLGNTGEVKVFREFNLERHSMLNGAFHFNDWQEITGIEVAENTVNKGNSSESSRSIDVPSKIYTSEVNNPFLFPALGINTVGTGRIVGISSATKALSQGQFGQFPLYAFTTEGVWALEVSAKGTYSAKQPVTRDVVLGDGESITQLDSSVVFATDRGIMLISGSQSVCISDNIDDINLLPADLPKFDTLAEISGVALPEDFVSGAPAAGAFRDFIRHCAMIYDYTNQRIIVYNKAFDYAYVYSLKTKLWGMMSCNILSGVNSYPDSLAMSRDFNLVSFSEAVVPDNGIAGLVITRPFKLDAPDVMKTIYDIIVRGVFQRGHVKTALYGSRDMMNWFVVGTSVDHRICNIAGTPYKFFRLVMLANLSETEYLHGCSISYNERMTNQLR